MLSRLRIALLTLATALAVVLGLPSPGEAAGARPKVGQCHQLTWAAAAAASDTKPPVACGRRHNLQTFAVVTASTPLAGLTPEQRSDLGARLCTPKFNRFVGRTEAMRAQSAYTFAFFAPTDAQIAAGANWFRCDLGKLASNRYAPRHGRLTRPVLPRHLSDSVRLCLTRAGWGTTCDRKHAWRSTKAFILRQSAYPTPEQVGPVADRKCPKGWDYARWSTPQGWALGHHAVVCYDKTKR